MSAREAVSARTMLGLTQDALAAELGLPPHVVTSWESGAMPVPRRYAGELRWRVAAAERQAALAASGLPECEWVAAWDREAIPDSASRRLAHLEALAAHAAHCPTCRAREAYVAEHFPPMPERPIRLWVRAVAGLADRVGRLPRWAQPAAWGALLFAAYSVFKIVLFLPRIAGAPRDWLMALAGLLVSATLGAVLGLGYGGVRMVWERWSHRSAA